MKPATNSSDFPSPVAPGAELPVKPGEAVRPPPPRFSDLAYDSARPRRPLTKREKEVLRLVCEGMSNAEIASDLGISRETVKTELKLIFRKIEVKNRTAAAVVFMRQGMV